MSQSTPDFSAFKKPEKKDRPNVKRKKKRLKDWQELRERILSTKRLVCFHCGKLLTRETACLDHFPYSRGARPDLFLEPSNLKVSCKSCNQSDSPARNAIHGKEQVL